MPDPDDFGSLDTNAWRNSRGQQRLLVPLDRIADRGVGARLRAFRIAQNVGELELTERMLANYGLKFSPDDIQRIESAPSATVEDLVLISGIIPAANEIVRL